MFRFTRSAGVVVAIAAQALYADVLEDGRARTQVASRSRTVASVKAAATPFADAVPILQVLREDLLPAELRTKTPAERKALWPGWTARRNTEIRARLAQGDEDSLVNFLLFGVTFTSKPRAKLADLLARSPAGAELLRARVDDLIAGVRAPGGNERLQFVREVTERDGIQVASSGSTDRLRRYFLDLTSRTLADILRYDPTLQPVPGNSATLFQDRGLSSDTAISTNFAIDSALESVKAKGLLSASRIRRVAVVGPGLDFVDKYEGYDFYPQQTIQPYAIIDSLARLDLARVPELEVTTFDLSPRVNGHIDKARQRARAGGAYTIQLVREAEPPWSQGLADYWARFGASVGQAADSVVPPPSVDKLSVRAVRVPPAVVLSVVPRDVNIIVQRITPMVDSERFDLIVATNILVYYDVFEQSLALMNVAAMLRPGGLLLCNSALSLLPGIPMRSVGSVDVVYNRELRSGERVGLYQRD